MRRPAAEAGSVLDREAEIAAAGVEMSVPSPPLRVPADSAREDGHSPSRYPPPYAMTDRDDLTAGAQSVAVTMPAVVSYDLDAPPPPPPTVPSDAFIAAVAAALVSVSVSSGGQSRRVSATVAAPATAPVYTVRAPGRRGSGTNLDDDPDSLQSPSVIARAEALIRRSSQGGTSSPLPPPQEQETLQSPSFVARMEATRRSSQSGAGGYGPNFRQGSDKPGGSLSRMSQRN